MDFKGKVLRPNQSLESGRVREFRIGCNRRLFQITTFCPDIIGPGPTHLYLIEDDVLILVDTGLPTSMAKKMFYSWRNQPMPSDIEALPDDYSEQELFSALKLTGHDVKDIDFIVLTHGHVDHYLIGRKLVAMSGARVAAHVSDSDQICNPWGMMKVWSERMSALMAMGMPPPMHSGGRGPIIRHEMAQFSLNVDCPIVQDGNLSINGFEKDYIRVHHYAGHSPGSISILLYNDERSEAVMLCGDTLLYPITPLPGDLIAYLRTLKAMKKLNDVKLVLPAHGKAMRNLHQRLNFLERHHERRLRLTYEACKEPRSIWQIATMSQYFDVYVDPEKFNPLAGQEAYVHLELLELAGGLRLSHIDGIVHYFQNSGEPFEEVYQRAQDIIDDEKKTMLLRR